MGGRWKGNASPGRPGPPPWVRQFPVPKSPPGLVPASFQPHRLSRGLREMTPGSSLQDSSPGLRTLGSMSVEERTFTEVHTLHASSAECTP